MAEELFPYPKWDQLLTVTRETLYMTAPSGVAAFILGIALGLALFLTARGELFLSHAVYSAIPLVVNISRPILFTILIVLLIPFTKAMIGTILGANAALPAPTVRAAPFHARLVEVVLREVDKGAIGAMCLMGVRLSTFVSRVLLPELSPVLVSRITVTLVALVSYSPVAGVIGAGGLGNLVYPEEFQRSHSDVTLAATMTILLIVFIIQLCGDVITSLLDKR